MMLYALFGFLFGFAVPYMARRFGKFMPATFAYALIQLLKPEKLIINKRTLPKLKAYFWRSFMYGLVTAALSYMVVWRFGEGLVWGPLLFVWILVLLSEIDYRIYLLPDILTVPLLLLGFAFVAFGGGWIGVSQSASGALAGYFLPVLASLFIVWKHRDAFGGGDIKLLAGIGSWLGVDGVLWVILLSCLLFCVYALIFGRRQGAFGPAISISAIIIAFWFFGV